jgi:hypothetical protein
MKNMVKVSKKEMNEMGWTREMKLDYYCNLNNIVTMATGNAKLGSQICGLSMPPVTTCRKDAPCRKGCYACKGHQMFPSVLGTYLKNLRIYNENPTVFFEQIENYLKYSGYRYMRWFDSGDIYDVDFFVGMIKLAKRLSDKKFMAFTKKYEIVNDYVANGGTIPTNLTIIFSAWDKNWKVNNPYNFPVAYVDFKNSELNPDFPVDIKDCDGHCSTCYKCWHLQEGDSVVFHQH